MKHITCSKKIKIKPFYQLGRKDLLNRIEKRDGKIKVSAAMTSEDFWLEAVSLNSLLLRAVNLRLLYGDSWSSITTRNGMTKWDLMELYMAKEKRALHISAAACNAFDFPNELLALGQKRKKKKKEEERGKMLK